MPQSEGETYPAPWKLVSGGWWNPETNELHTTEGFREWLAANPLMKDCLAHRCLPHRNVRPYNETASGAECAECEIVRLRDALQALADAVDQRLFDANWLPLINARRVLERTA